MNVQVIEKTEDWWGSDTKEERYQCLNCQYVECLNCLSPKSKATVITMINKFSQPPHDEVWRTKGVMREVVALYFDGYDDLAIAEILGLPKRRVTYYRFQLQLPYPHLDTQVERKEFLKRWLEKFGVLSMAQNLRTHVLSAESMDSP